MKNIYKIVCLILLFQSGRILAQESLEGRVVNKMGEGIGFVSLELMPSGIRTGTDASGKFILSKDGVQQIRFSRQGFRSFSRRIGNTLNLGDIVMDSLTNQIEEVVINTGYAVQEQHKSTGSIVHLNNELLNLSSSSNIIDRLEGITSGLQFDRRLDMGEKTYSPSLRMRGLGSINSSTQPLIILDDFPYDGDLNSINPSDIESVTILKDASASAIWGAKAGNGVIVLTSKRGAQNEGFKINLNTNWIIGEKPDLYYDPSRLNASSTMELEEYLYGLGNYSFNDRTFIPDYVSLMSKRDKGEISQSEFDLSESKMRNSDIREDALRYLYQPEQSYRGFLSLSGKTERHNYRSSFGWEKNYATIIGNESQRTTLTLFDQFQITPAFSVYSDIQLGLLKSNNNGYGIDRLTSSGSPASTYTVFFNEDGTPKGLNYQYNHSYINRAEEIGLLNWSFNPITDRDLRYLEQVSHNVQLGFGLEYRVLKGLELTLKYRYQNQLGNRQNLYKEESYYVRNLVNMYTQGDGTRIIPHGGIKEGNMQKDEFQNARIQFNYNQTFGTEHEMQLLGGSEINHQRYINEAGYRFYAYDENNLTHIDILNFNSMYPLRPTGAGFIPTGGFVESQRTNRFISHYINGVYQFKQNHILSASLRWDASNLFGVKTNQRGVPLWSIGLSENLLPYFHLADNSIGLLRLRGSYGVSGNINNTISSLPTMRLENFDFISGLPYGILTSAGNPSLRWEKLTTFNLGLDFAMFSNRLRGSLDFYNKNGKDLIGPDFLDPTSGIISQDGSYLIDNRINYADLNSKGIDLSLSFNALNKDDFSWTVDLLWSYTINRILNYKASKSAVGSNYISGTLPKEGFSKDALFSWKYNGLDPSSGQLITPAGDMDYSGYYRNAKFEDLLQTGLAFPPYQGSVRNSFRFKRLTLSALLEWKNGFNFRRSSIDYTRLLSSATTHVDYENRWKQAGDELITQIPSFPKTRNSSRDALFTGSEVLIEKGDFLRLSSLNLSYRFKSARHTKFEMNGILQVQNVGILWRANNKGIDPESVRSTYPRQRTYTLGLQFEW